MPTTLILFPDTNLFVQCKPLEQLDWNIFSNFEEIRIFLTRPVQSEIDSHKGKGSGRLSKRARSASSLFRELLQPNVEHKIISQDPLVTLHLRQDLKTAPELNEILSYEERDDQLVGIAYGYSKRNPDQEVRLLTHDTGPMASARLVNLAFNEVPEAWLLAPETDEAEKRLNQLQNELIRYQKSEPKFTLSIVNDSAQNKKINIDIIRYTALNEEEVQDLIQQIKSRFPMETKFDQNGRSDTDLKHEILRISSLGGSFKPASEAQISDYQNIRYPDWLSKCENTLRSIHNNLKTVWPEIRINLCNEGSRPAEDALIEISTSGNFLIAPVETEENKENNAAVTLPNAPAPPKGEWKKPLEFGETIKAMRIVQGPAFDSDLLSFTPPFIPKKRDPNAFYFKPERPSTPVQRISFTCEQWRHQIEPEEFSLVIYRGLAGIINGSLKIEVHASNLTIPFIATIPLQINVKETSVLNLAQELVDNLKMSSGFKIGFGNSQ